MGWCSRSPPVRRALSSRLRLQHLKKVRVQRRDAEISLGFVLMKRCSSGFIQHEDHATVHDGHIVTEPVQRKAPGSVKNPEKDGLLSISKIKLLLMELKRKEMSLDAEAEAFLAIQQFKGKDDMIQEFSYVRHHHEGVECGSMKGRYDEYCQRRYSRTYSYTEKLSGLHAENTKLKAQTSSTTILSRTILMLEFRIAFRQHSVHPNYVMVDLSKGHGTSNYTHLLNDMMSASTSLSYLQKPRSTKTCIWLVGLNHLNFGTLNWKLTRKILRGKITILTVRQIYIWTSADNENGKDQTERKYVLVIGNDYTRFDGTDMGTEFVNKNLYGWFGCVGISHVYERTSVSTTERRCRKRNELLWKC
ncbi:hypothetical protein Tco_0158659 [Tanacetum coccineum]